MIIKKIKLRNFQSHNDTEILLSEGLTVILGPTDNGKSAIIRALKWVLYNEPRGSDFITAGCKTCRVSLEMGDGTIITRERDGSRNRYVLQKGDCEQVFEGFGSNVPAEIINAHGIPKIQIDTDKSTIVNLAEQLEPPFLLSESGGNRAKALGRLIGIHIIDAAQRATSRDLVETQQHNRTLNNNIEGLRKELERYKDLHLIKAEINLQKKLLTQLRDKGERFTELYNIRQKLYPAEADIVILKNLLLKLGFLDRLMRYTSKAEDLGQRHERLTNLKKRIEDNEIAVTMENTVLAKTDSITRAEITYKEMESRSRKMANLSRLRRDIVNIDKSLTSTTDTIEKTHDVFSAEETLKDILNGLGKYQKLASIKNKSDTVNDQIKSQNSVIDETSRIFDAVQKINNAESMLSNLSRLSGLKISISENEVSLRKGADYINNLLSGLNNVTLQYGHLLRKLSKCPTCLSAIDESTASRIVSELMNTEK